MSDEPQGGGPEFFPTIEHAADSLGNVAERLAHGYVAPTARVLHPGAVVKFDLRVSDPGNVGWRWKVIVPAGPDAAVTVDGDRIIWHVTGRDLADYAEVRIYLVGERDDHRFHSDDVGPSDDVVTFLYGVLPG